MSDDISGFEQELLQRVKEKLKLLNDIPIEPLANTSLENLQGTYSGINIRGT